MKRVVQLLKETFKEFQSDKATRLAAALSFYTALSIAPLLVLLVTVIGWFFGDGTAQDELMGRISEMVGPEGAQVAESVIQSADQPNVATMAGLLSLATLLWGASNVFSQLQESLNTIWDVELKPGQGIIATIKERFLSFGMILVIGFLLLVSLVLTAVLNAISSGFNDLLPGSEILWQIVNFVVSFGVVTLLFGLIYRILPDVRIAWRTVWVGAAVTALLFTIGKYLLGLYLAHQSTSSAFGAAGSLLVFLIWVYYSAQIFFFGAEFTQVYAQHHGEEIQPDEKAQFIGRKHPTGTGQATAQQRTQALPAQRHAAVRVPTPVAQQSTRQPSPVTRLLMLAGTFLLARRSSRK